jgi:multicopper oxidase
VSAVLTRRRLLTGAAGAVGLVTLGACSRNDGAPGGSTVSPTSAAVRQAERARRTEGSRLVSAQLTARPVTIDLGGPKVDTWAYGDNLPGPLLRARAGDRIRVDLTNELPDDTSIHWHGIALRNDMDGVPGITQDPVGSGSTFRYEFTIPDPGTYFYHPHVGVQLDRGLYGVLVVDDPAEPGRYDAEWIVVLDDWLDGTGRTPDQVLASLDAMDGMSDDMGGMDMDGMSTNMGGMNMGGGRSPILGDAGDVRYQHFLLNGRVPTSPAQLSAKPGDRVRIRIVNAASDTAFRVALADHRLSVTHADGFPVQRQSTDAVLLAMGERLDVEVTLGDGVFPFVATPEGKPGVARALVRTGSGRTPPPMLRPVELNGRVLLGNGLKAAPDVRLDERPVDSTHELVLGGTMMPYRWTINGKTYPDTDPLPVEQGERVRLRLVNQSMMFHPIHIHGHTFAVTGGGPRKDTTVVLPMRSLDIDLDADNPGQWATHCHNIYHAERGMMSTLSYQE